MRPRRHMRNPFLRGDFPVKKLIRTPMRKSMKRLVIKELMLAISFAKKRNGRIGNANCF
jgi:hypothetical protein